MQALDLPGQAPATGEDPPASGHGATFRESFATALLLLLVAMAVSLLMRAAVARVPLERDEGEYAYIAQRWLQGDVPYRDAFDQKPPAVFAIYALLFAAGGDSPATIHWLGHAFLLAAAVALWSLVRREAGDRAAALTALVLLVAAMDSAVLGSAANTEVFALLPLCAGTGAAFRGLRGGGWPQWLVTGVWGGLALCCKQVTAPVVLFWGLLALCAPPASTRAWRAARALANGALVVLGCALVVAPVCAWFALHGSWSAFLDAVVGHNLAYSGRIPLASYLPRFIAQLRPLVGHQLLPFLAAGIGVVAMWRRGRRPTLVLLAWLLASFAAVSVSGYYWKHYLMLLLPPIAVLAGVGAAAVGAGRRAALGLAGLAIVAWPVLVDGSYWRAASPLAASRYLYGPEPFAESAALARVIAAHSSPADRIFVFGSEPQLYFYAERRSVSRYIFLYPLYSGVADAAARQREVIAELRRRPPRLVVVVPVVTSFLRAPSSPRLLDDALLAMLARDYQSLAATAVEPDGSFRVVPAAPRPDGGGLGYPLAAGETLTLTLAERRPAAP